MGGNVYMDIYVCTRINMCMCMYMRVSVKICVNNHVYIFVWCNRVCMVACYNIADSLV